MKQWLASLVRDEQQFWWASAFLLGSIAALKGLRRPSYWAASQAQLDYRHGFIKRGMLGQVYNSLHINQYHRLSAVFFLEVLLLFVLLAVLTRQSRLAERMGSPMVIAAAAGSYVTTYLVHLAGYADIVNACLTILLLLVRDPGKRFLLGLPVACAALLIHENYLVLFMPVVLLSFALDALLAHSSMKRVRCLSFAGILGSLAVLFAFAISRKSTVSPAETLQWSREVQSRVDFPVLPQMYGFFAWSLRHNLAVMWYVEWRSYWYWTEQAISVLVLLPILLLFVHMAWRFVPGTITPDEGSSRKWIKAATLLSFAAPLGMHLIAWDQVRWNVYCVLDAYLALNLLSMYLPEAKLTLSAAERNVTVLIIAIGMASGYGLLDGSKVNPYPFFPLALQNKATQHDGYPVHF